MKGRRDEGIMGQDGQEDKALICTRWGGINWTIVSRHRGSFLKCIFILLTL
jgi:hypothetical protein